ncbi:MAG: transcription termination/antitermination protein NusG [Pseudomonadota bacterium]
MAKARWYIVHAYSNFEKKVAQAIRDQASMKGLEDLIEEMEVPTREEVEIVRGKKKTIEKRDFPGYVLMKATLTDDVYHLVKGTPKVTGFLGADGGKKPLPVPQREIDRILGTAEAPREEFVKPTISFEIGEEVRVNEGAFQGFEGSVDEWDAETGRLKVNVSIFGRATPVDLEYTQVDKLN